MSTPTESPKLSTRELQIVHLAEQGLTDKQIAHQLGISKATVSTYWVRVRDKLGKVSRTELVATTLKADWDHQIEELRREHIGETDHSEGEPRTDPFWREVIEAAPDGILLVSESGQITDLNASAAEMFGYERSELLSQPVTVLVPEHFRTDHAQCQDEYMKSPEKRAMGEGTCTCAVRKDGSPIPVDIALGAVRTPVGENVICIVRTTTATSDCTDLCG